MDSEVGSLTIWHRLKYKFMMTKSACQKLLDWGFKQNKKNQSLFAEWFEKNYKDFNDDRIDYTEKKINEIINIFEKRIKTN